MDNSTKIQLRIKTAELEQIDTAAARAGLNRSQYMIQAALGQTTKPAAAAILEQIPEVKPASSLLRPASGCRSCGSLNGMHQKWCAA